MGSLTRVGLIGLLAATGLSACREESASCDETPMDHSQAPRIPDIHIVVADRRPEGCGMGYSLDVTYRGTGSSDDTMARVERHLLANGWRSTPCVSTVERCFLSGTGGLFMGAATAEAARAHNESEDRTTHVIVPAGTPGDVVAQVSSMRR